MTRERLTRSSHMFFAFVNSWRYVGREGDRFIRRKLRNRVKIAARVEEDFTYTYIQTYFI